MSKKFISISGFCLVILTISACAFSYEYDITWKPFPYISPLTPQNANNCSPIRLDNISNLHLLNEFDRPDDLIALDLAFQSNSRLVVVYRNYDGSDHQVFFENPINGRLDKSISIPWLHPSLTKLAERGKYLITVEDRLEIIEKRQQQMEPEKNTPFTVALVDIWDLESQELKRTYAATTTPLAVAIEPHGQYAVWTPSDASDIVPFSTEYGARLDFSNGMWVSSLPGYNGDQVDTASMIVFDHVGKTYAWLRKSPRLENNLIGVKDLTDTTAIDEFISSGSHTRSQTVFDMSFDYSRQWLAILRERSIVIHDLYSWFDSGKAQVQILPTEQGKLRFSPYNEILAIASANGVELRRRDDLSILLVLSQAPSGLLSFSHDGCYLATVDNDKLVQVWGIR